MKAKDELNIEHLRMDETEYMVFIKDRARPVVTYAVICSNCSTTYHSFDINLIGLGTWGKGWRVIDNKVKCPECVK